jgi:hypothetical protein
MDLQILAFDTNEASDELPRIFTNRLLDELGNAMPHNDDPALTTGEAQEAEADRSEAARVLFEALRPRNPVQAALAARAVAAHHASMDIYVRAARPGTSDEKAIRLRNSALAASRSFDTSLSTLEKRQSKPSPAPQDNAEAATDTPEPRRPANIAPEPSAEPAPPRRPAPGPGLEPAWAADPTPESMPDQMRAQPGPGSSTPGSGQAAKT